MFGLGWQLVVFVEASQRFFEELGLGVGAWEAIDYPAFVLWQRPDRFAENVDDYLVLDRLPGVKGIKSDLTQLHDHFTVDMVAFNLVRALGRV